MKVCMLVHRYYDHDPRVRRYVESAAGTDIEIDILCLRPSHHRSEARDTDVRVTTIPVRHTAASLAGLAVEYVLAFVCFTVRLTLLHARQRFDVIHVHNMPDFYVFTATLPRLMGCKVVLDIHDPMPEFYTSKVGASPTSLLSRVMRFQERLSTSFSHAVVTANANFRDNLIRRGVPESKVTVVRNVPDARVFDRSAVQRTDSGDHFTLIYTGTIAPRYGLDVAIRALRHLVDPIPEIRLLILGKENEHADELAELAQRVGLNDYVSILPPVPIEEVPRQLAGADVGVYPARVDAHMNIATPTKVMEYAYMGLPVVASRVRILEQLFSDEAISFFEPENEAQFAENVLELYRDAKLRRQLVENADLIYVKRQRWSNEWDAYVDLLGRLGFGRQSSSELRSESAV